MNRPIPRGRSDLLFVFWLDEDLLVTVASLCLRFFFTGKSNLSLGMFLCFSTGFFEKTIENRSDVINSSFSNNIYFVTSTPKYFAFLDIFLTADVR